MGRARLGRTLRTDDDGQLWCAVPPHARFSYFGDPEKTAAAWRDTADGPAFTVGDLGRLDDDGYIFLDGRREDLVISGGVNVYPAEIESCLEGHPDVAEVVVVGVPDEEFGQIVGAIVVPAEGVDLDEANLAGYVKERLAYFKVPSRWVITSDALPRTATGKVVRAEVMDRFKES